MGFKEIDSLVEGRANINKKIKSTNFQLLGSTTLGFGGLGLTQQPDLLHALNVVVPFLGLSYVFATEFFTLKNLVDIKNKNYSVQHLEKLFKTNNTDETTLSKTWLSLKSQFGNLEDVFSNNKTLSEKVIDGTNKIESVLGDMRKSVATTKMKI